MDLDYFVLSVKSPRQFDSLRTAQRRGSTFESGGPDEPMGGMLGGALANEAPSADSVKIETATLSERQANDEARNPSSVMAPVMPVMLVAPCLPAEFGLLSDGDPVALATSAKSSWGISAVGADATTLTGAGVAVAVLDTGIDVNHPAFAGVNIIPQNFTSDGDIKDVSDRQGHGTHCAGTIFGRDVGGVRIGVARGVTNVMIGKVLDNNGRGSTASVLKALHWASGQGANIVSMSLGFDFPGMQEQLVGAGRPQKLATSIALKAYRENLRLFETLIAFLTLENPASSGLVVVAASGNESMRHVDANFVIDTSLPAAASASIISVGAIGRKDGLFSIAPFSNVNPILCAPGVDIVSAQPGGGLAAMSGTSMACPHVAGLAALWWESARRQGSASGSMVQAQVRASANAANFLPGVTIADRGAGRATAPTAMV